MLGCNKILQDHVPAILVSMVAAAHGHLQGCTFVTVPQALREKTVK